MQLLRELVPLVNRPFAEKLMEAQGLIAHNLGAYKGKVVATFSGGKDSLITTFIANVIQPGLPVVFNNTGVEYPETVPYIKQVADRYGWNLITTKPEKGFWECVKEYGFATGKRGQGAKDDKCCYWLKEKPMMQALRDTGAGAMLTGQTATENITRMFSARKYGNCFDSKKWGVRRVHPILWWTEDEVFQYIADMGLPLNPIYSKGMKRCGCMPCTAYKDWEKNLRRVNPKLYAYIKQHKDRQFVMGGLDNL